MALIGKGRPWREIFGVTTSLSKHGWDLNAIKAWRTAQNEAGKPSGLRDFYTEHGLCWDCRCIGYQVTGYDEAVKEQLYSPCTSCGGSGTIPDSEG